MLADVLSDPHAIVQMKAAVFKVQVRCSELKLLMMSAAKP